MMLKREKSPVKETLDNIDYGIFSIIDTRIACQKLKLNIEGKNLDEILRELQNLKTKILIENEKER